MNKFIEPLKKCILMKDFTEDDIDNFLNKVNYTICNYSREEVIAFEGSNCSSIGIVLSGNVEVQRIYASGKSITMGVLREGNIFGEVVVFSNKNTYPSTIISSHNSTVMFISKANILKLCNLAPIFLKNFMTLLSNKILMLNKKLKNISYQTIRQKITYFILDEYKVQNKLTIKLDMTKKSLAEQLGIPRPSLSRELLNMERENLIHMNKNIITIIDINSMYNLLY
ncbi:CRP-like cAMP-binding protein [Clostridium algifaecis]|uniref:CRP-like cAMP-binding protein n=1 Tax=Clostridium algifaecis TaxID=1472040 RepID=A0ABS4KUF7_9CLOT|nr:Crp/Fnr family transcriptional regulator [Clostridium algifaecis]MBP2033687.1 CRP-like cAMP-binding protein [Clostridium algifaecis]